MGHHAQGTGKPMAIAVLCEKTTPANQLISRITDRMPAIQLPEDCATWLGEADASLMGVRGVLRTFEDAGNWTMSEQEPSRKTKASKSSPQASLF